MMPCTANSSRFFNKHWHEKSNSDLVLDTGTTSQDRDHRYNRGDRSGCHIPFPKTCSLRQRVNTLKAT